MNHRRRHHRALRHARRRMTDAQVFEAVLRQQMQHLTNDIFRDSLLLAFIEKRHH